MTCRLLGGHLLQQASLLSIILVLLAGVAGAVAHADDRGIGPLHVADSLEFLVPASAALLDSSQTIEPFLLDLDHAPPDWKVVLGRDGSSHDRLFALNQARNEQRRRRETPAGSIAFVWEGELSTYDGEASGYRVAIGPKMIETRWGLVRFKPANLPGNLIAVPGSAQARDIRQRLRRGDKVEVDVVMIGRLIEEESIIYDASHEQEGIGLVMPVVHVEQVVYVLRTPPGGHHSSSSVQ